MIDLKLLKKQVNEIEMDALNLNIEAARSSNGPVLNAIANRIERVAETMKKEIAEEERIRRILAQGLKEV